MTSSELFLSPENVIHINALPLVPQDLGIPLARRVRGGPAKKSFVTGVGTEHCELVSW